MVPLPDPGPFETGIVLTTWLNAMRDLGLAARDQPATIADRLAAQSIPNNANTLVAFDTEIFDNYGTFTATSSTIILQAAGVYVVTGGGTWAANATGARLASIRHNGNDVNGGTWEQPALTGGAQTFMSHCATINAAIGDSVTYAVFQNSGGALNISAVRIGITRASGT